MDNNIPRNTPALLGMIGSRQTSIGQTLTASTARIDQLRNSLFNRFEKLLEQAQASDGSWHLVAMRIYWCRHRLTSAQTAERKE